MSGFLEVQNNFDCQALCSVFGRASEISQWPPKISLRGRRIHQLHNFLKFLVLWSVRKQFSVKSVISDLFVVQSEGNACTRFEVLMDLASLYKWATRAPSVPDDVRVEGVMNQSTSFGIVAPRPNPSRWHVIVRG